MEVSGGEEPPPAAPCGGQRRMGISPASRPRSHPATLPLLSRVSAVTMASSSGPSSSLAAAVDGLLADTVLGALGPTPSPKRKAPEPVEAGNAEDSAAAVQVQVRRLQETFDRRWNSSALSLMLAASRPCRPCPPTGLQACEAEAPPAKKAKTLERTVNVSVSTAATTVATTAISPAHAPDTLLLGAAPAPAVDVEAALEELLGEDEELPSTQPLACTQPAASTQPAAASPPRVPGAPAAAPSEPAACDAQHPASPAAVVPVGEGQASEETDEAGHGDQLPSTQPAAGSCGSAAPGSRPPAAPSASACPTAKVLAAIAAPGGALEAAGPAPTTATTSAAPAACPAHHHWPATHCPPPTAHHPLPTTTLPTTFLPPASASAAAPPAAPTPAAAGDAACAAAAAATAAPADHTNLELPMATTCVNMLKPVRRVGCAGLTFGLWVLASGYDSRFKDCGHGSRSELPALHSITPCAGRASGLAGQWPQRQLRRRPLDRQQQRGGCWAVLLFLSLNYPSRAAAPVPAPIIFLTSPTPSLCCHCL